MLSTHCSVTVPVASRHPMSGGTGEKEGRNGRERRKREMEWTNRKERGGFLDGWDCFMLAIILSIFLIDRIFYNFDRWKKIQTEYRINMSTCQNKHHKKMATQNQIVRS